MRELMEQNLTKFVTAGQYRGHIENTLVNGKRVFKGCEDALMMVVLIAKVQVRIHIYVHNFTRATYLVYVCI